MKKLQAQWVKRLLVVGLMVLSIFIFNVTTPSLADTVTALDLSIFGEGLPSNWYLENEQGNEALLNLGRDLYFDQRLSKNQDISCNSCHQLNHYGVDHKPVSPGHRGQLGQRNSPTVYNAAGQISQFWDGRAADVEAQAQGPILNPGEMAMPSEAAVLAVLNSMPEYVAAFEQAFPNEAKPVTYDHVGTAIGAFERGLVTPSPLDAYLAGDTTALTAKQLRGASTFINTGCVQCHNGPNVGGQLYQKAGLVQDWPNQDDLGRFKVTGQDADQLYFKVPTLRNVAKTGPYFHDGSVKKLDDAVIQMAHTQLGKDLSRQEVGDIVAFLKSLTGDLPTSYIQQAQLPASTDSTPLPDPT